MNAALACNLSPPSNLFLVCVRLIHKSTTTERVRKESLALMSLTIRCYADDSRMSATHALVPRREEKLIGSRQGEMREPVGQHHSLVRMTKEVASGEWVAQVFVRELVPGCYTPGDVVVRKK